MSAVAPFWGPLCGPVLGSAFHFHYAWPQNGVQNMTPILGPFFPPKMRFFREHDHHVSPPLRAKMDPKMETRLKLFAAKPWTQNWVQISASNGGLKMRPRSVSRGPILGSIVRPRFGVRLSFSLRVAPKWGPKYDPHFGAIFPTKNAFFS